jgi:hypothetical protein
MPTSERALAKDALPSVSTLRKRTRKNYTYENLVNLASGLRRQGSFETAVGVLGQALLIAPESPAAWHNLGQVFSDLGDFRRVPQCCQKALECHEKLKTPPGMVQETLLAFAYSLMRLGQFETVWPLWEAARYGTSWHSFPNLPAWRGEPEARLLIVPEGGFGDGFNFLRWLPALQQPWDLLLWPPLCELAERAIRQSVPRHVPILGEPQHTIFPMSHAFEPHELARYTHCTSIMSLIAYSGMTDWKDIPIPLDWAPPSRPDRQLEKAIGFCWRAEENGVQRQNRSLDDATADAIGKFIARHGLKVISLVPEKQSLHRERPLRTPRQVVQDETLLAGWTATAQTIQQCQAVVTVDTAVCHLAASLDIPTLVLLPRRSDWKWGLPEDVLPRWYRTLSAHRNESAKGWDVSGILQAVGGLLQASTRA